MKAICTVCKNEKEIRPYRAKSFKFCSTKCKYIKMRGLKPWNYGRKYTEEQKKRLDISGLKIGRDRKYHQCLSKSYGAIHYWVRKNKGKAKVCTRCGLNGGIRGCTWANKDHKYKRKLSDYISLCNKCHFHYDVENGLRDAVINPKSKQC